MSQCVSCNLLFSTVNSSVIPTWWLQQCSKIVLHNWSKKVVLFLPEIRVENGSFQTCFSGKRIMFLLLFRRQTHCVNFFRLLFINITCDVQRMSKLVLFQLVRTTNDSESTAFFQKLCKTLNVTRDKRQASQVSAALAWNSKKYASVIGYFRLYLC